MILVLTTFCGCRVPQDKVDRYLRSLPYVEQLKIQRYKRWEDSQLALFGRLLLKKGLSLLGGKNDSMLIEFTRYDKPFIKGGPYFNISHSGQYAVCAISIDQEIGIDIEYRQPINIEDFKTQWSSRELSELTISQDPLQLFYRFWTRKEAIIKADGRGLSLPLTQLDVTGSIVTIGQKQWHLSKIQIDDNYECHLARQTAKAEVRQVHLAF